MCTWHGTTLHSSARHGTAQLGAARRYGAGGYIAHLPVDSLASVRQAFDDLLDNGWFMPGRPLTSVPVRACPCMCMHISMCACGCTCARREACMRVHLSVEICAGMLTHIHVDVHGHACMCAPLHMIHNRVLMQLYLRVNTCTHMRARGHAHARTRTH